MPARNVKPAVSAVQPTVVSTKQSLGTTLGKITARNAARAGENAVMFGEAYSFVYGMEKSLNQQRRADSLAALKAEYGIS
jgi:hypothetical protein